jgi:hypothetical protein
MADVFERTLDKTPLGNIRKQQYFELMQSYGAKFVSALVKFSEKTYIKHGTSQIMFFAKIEDSKNNSFKFKNVPLAQLLEVAKRNKSGLSYMFWHSYNQNKKYHKDYIFFEYVDEKQESYYYKLNRSTLEIEFDTAQATDESWEEYQNDIGQKRLRIIIDSN